MGGVAMFVCWTASSYFTVDYQLFHSNTYDLRLGTEYYTPGDTGPATLECIQNLADSYRARTWPRFSRALDYPCSPALARSTPPYD